MTEVLELLPYKERFKPWACLVWRKNAGGGLVTVLVIYYKEEGDRLFSVATEGRKEVMGFMCSKGD